MRLIIFIILMLLQQQPGAEPTISVLRDETTHLTLGNSLDITVAVDPGAELSGSQIKLLPLSLENLRTESIVSRTEKVKIDGKARLLHYFDIQLEALEAGNAVIGEFQIEISNDGESSDSAKPLLYTRPGFTLEVEQPFEWQNAWLWILIIGAILGAGLFIFIRLKRTRSDTIPAEQSEQEIRRSRKIRDLEDLIIRTEWKKAVDLAFAELLRETALQGGSDDPAAHRLDSELIAAISQNQPDFAAAYRLGEEVRYGGFTPSRREAAFMVKSLKDMYSKSFE